MREDGSNTVAMFYTDLKTALMCLLANTGERGARARYALIYY